MAESFSLGAGTTARVRIVFIYRKSRSTYGVRRVHAKLTLHHGIAVSENPSRD